MQSLKLGSGSRAVGRPGEEGVEKPPAGGLERGAGYVQLLLPTAGIDLGKGRQNCEIKD